MAIVLSQQQHDALAAAGDAPLVVVDEHTQRTYYLIPAETLGRLNAMLTEADFDPRELYPLIAKSAGAAGWNDPIMDEYDRYDEHRK
jgi:hypothetical protein